MVILPLQSDKYYVGFNLSQPKTSYLGCADGWNFLMKPLTIHS